MSGTVRRIGIFSNHFHARMKRGVGVVAVQLTHHLLQQLPETRFTLIDSLVRPADKANMPKFDQPNVEERIIPVPGRLFAAATR